MEKIVRGALSKYSHYLVEAQLYEEHEAMILDGFAKSTLLSAEQKTKEHALLEKKIAVITCWLRLLNDREAFVIRHRIIDGVGWRGVVAAYEQQFGHQARCERSLKRYQTVAIKKMVACANEYANMVDLLFPNEQVSYLESQTKGGFV